VTLFCCVSTQTFFSAQKLPSVVDDDDDDDDDDVNAILTCARKLGVKPAQSTARPKKIKITKNEKKNR